MDRAQHRSESLRDATDLLLNGYWKPARPKTSENSNYENTSVPSYTNNSTHHTTHHTTRHRGRSRGPAKRNHVSPSVEDEIDSLARELGSAQISSSDPPMRGVIDQYPILIESDITPAEKAKLEAEIRGEDDSKNQETRFVLVPKNDADSVESVNKEELKRDARHKRSSSARNHDKPPESQKKESVSGRYGPIPGRKPTEGETHQVHRESKETRTNRQDLPSINTKEVRPQFKRSASAYPCIESEKDQSFQSTGASRRPTADGLLTPDVGRSHSRGFFDQASTPSGRVSPRQKSGSQTPTFVDEKRSSKDSWSQSSRPSSSHESKSRPPTRESNDKTSKLPYGNDRFASSYSERSTESWEANRLSKTNSLQDTVRYPPSEEESDYDGSRRHRSRDSRHRHSRESETSRRHHRSPTRSNRSSTFDVSLQAKQPSPIPSPRVSPSGTPRAEHFGRSETFPNSQGAHKIPSRPVSPLSATEDVSSSKKLSPLERPSSHRSNSRQSPSTGGANRPYSSPRSSQASLSMPMPPGADLDFLASDSDDYPPPNYKYPTSSKEYWQPPTFQPPSSSDYPKRPFGSYRRYSEDIESGNAAPLAPCPRTTFTRGRNDWLSLRQCRNFNICSSCYASTIAPTQFRNHFVPAPFRPADVEVLCDFGSSPWYRIAWLLTLKEGRKDLGLFYQLAQITENTEPCLGKHEAIRQWHSIVDPKTGHPIRNFDVCYSCAKTVEALLPPLKGIFVRNDAIPAGSPRICDLRFDSKHFIQYFDALETTADAAESSYGKPDTRHLANVIRRLSMIEECQHDEDLTDCYWHIITQLPEFTVCPECWDEVVRPELEKRKAIPAMFNKTQQRLLKSSCQLYSKRMRNIFKTAVDNDDYLFLASKARERKAIEAGYKANVAELRRLVRAAGPSAAAAEREIERLTDEWKKWE